MLATNSAPRHPHFAELVAGGTRICPYCAAQLPTERARQCFCCGYDWHDPRAIVCRGAGVRGPSARRRRPPVFWQLLFWCTAAQLLCAAVVLLLVQLPLTVILAAAITAPMLAFFAHRSEESPARAGLWNSGARKLLALVFSGICLARPDWTAAVALMAFVLICGYWFIVRLWKAKAPTVIDAMVWLAPIVIFAATWLHNPVVAVRAVALTLGAAELMDVLWLLRAGLRKWRGKGAPSERATAASRLARMLALAAWSTGACGAGIPQGIAADGAECPNFILVITDDQGYGDLGCHGNPIIQTPHLDRLHRESVRLTDFHVSPTCAPTRSALLTGRHEFKNGVTHTIHERERLSLGAITLPQVLKGAGYTTGIFGKWHLGDEDDYQPDKRGFDEVFIHGAGGIGQTYPGSCGDAPGNSYFNPAIRHNGKFVKTMGYCTDVFFRQALSWIEIVKDQGKPFYCQLALNAPHAPLDCPQEYEARYADNVPPDVAKFYGMITNIDDNMGKLLAALREWNLERRTVVIFMTDNGTATGHKVYNAGMRGQKGTAYNGGTRVPSFWRWPGTLPAGVDVHRFCCHWDFFPTVAELAGIRLPEEAARQIEGRSFAPLLRDTNAPWPDRYFFTHVGRWERGKAAESQFGQCAVRYGRFHLVNEGKSGKKQWALYDLAADPGETNNVVDRHPQLVSQMESAYNAWWRDVLPRMENEDAVGPKVNPFKAAFWKQFGGGPEK